MKSTLIIFTNNAGNLLYIYFNRLENILIVIINSCPSNDNYDKNTNLLNKVLFKYFIFKNCSCSMKIKIYSK